MLRQFVKSSVRPIRPSVRPSVCKGQKRHVNFFNINFLVPTQSSPFGGPRKKFTRLISWERTQKSDPHHLFFGGGLGSKKRGPERAIFGHSNFSSLFFPAANLSLFGSCSSDVQQRSVGRVRKQENGLAGLLQVLANPNWSVDWRPCGSDEKSLCKRFWTPFAATRRHLDSCIQTQKPSHPVNLAASRKRCDLESAETLRFLPVPQKIAVIFLQQNLRFCTLRFENAAIFSRLRFFLGDAKLVKAYLVLLPESPPPSDHFQLKLSPLPMTDVSRPSREIFEIGETII